jgi:hypothetical protein
MRDGVAVRRARRGGAERHVLFRTFIVRFLRRERCGAA